MRFLAGFFLSILLGAAGTPVATWKPAVSTEQAPNDPDDPAIWINREEPARSVIIGTNKAAAPNGALVVFDLSGKKLQTISGLDRPNNVDLRQNVHLRNRILDIVAVTERNQRALRFYEVERATRQLKELGSAPVFEGEQGEAAAPMGVALYVRPSDRVLFVVLCRKTGPAEGYLWQYRVDPGPVLHLVRKFGSFSQHKEIESIVVDDALDSVVTR